VALAELGVEAFGLIPLGWRVSTPVARGRDPEGVDRYIGVGTIVLIVLIIYFIRRA
jgi:hypothetical protein